ncbi:DUF2268 domain-containing protein [Chitinophaga nivalis]|uniref:DUF2268 domain-containing protein n=1 Tax=Chitinophaga nivalis TaxID=2991709 RepID=A0ABT3IH51_9BACT|nr:DUF2268 domain-containing protein [Chitinophaga nivalis]MCW3467024.1 DUF2268 domain-containing protein [Chitinophaga nivalis]MCW3483285.1 DUF2268 domain-containing protein [Chitinophaga nivalis]
MRKNTGLLHKAMPACLMAFIFFLTPGFTAKGQQASHVFTSDIDNFWRAFDSVQTTKEKDQQIAFMKSLYTDQATEGLKYFMELRKFDAAKLVESVNKYPKFWQSIRGNTLRIKPQIPAIEKYIQQFRQLYPDFRPAKIFFTITAIRAAGTTQDSLVLIGSEITMGNKYTDISEFSDKRLEHFFASKTSDNIVPVVIHEYVHTQQKREGVILLGQAISEGACDFITELVLKEPLTHLYLEYGRKNEDTLKQQFKKEMLGVDISNWLYNGATSKTMGDLGYFMGYTICKSYYQHAKDKRQAVKDIISLDYADQAAILQFLEQSKYY